MNNIFRIAGRLFKGIALLLGLALLVVTLTPLDSWWVGLLQGPWTEARGDVLIVLTGEILANGIIGETSYWRSAYAVMAWREGGWRRVVVSGGGGGGPFPVADSIVTFLVAGGIPREAIVVETDSRSTRDSAVNLASTLRHEPGRKVLLTSDYHMFRAVRAFRKAGLDVTPRPLPDAGKRARSWNLRWQAFQDLFTETLKIVYYRARGWT